MRNRARQQIQNAVYRISAHGGVRIKIALAAIAHILHQRYYGVFVDPVLGCNLRCQMCYFSDREYAASLHGKLSPMQSEALARNLLPRAFRLQIGCGAEPTLAAESLEQWVALGKQWNVPFISMVTNGNRLSADVLYRLALCGLDELTLSLHGTTQPTYEWLMRGAKFDRFLELLQSYRTVHEEFPHLALHINYTLNKDNLAELVFLPELLGDYPLKIVQIRSAQRMGTSEYNHFDPSPLVAEYASIIQPTIDKLKARGVEVLCPSAEKMA